MRVDENWRPVVGYEDHYSVSDCGRVRRTRGGQGTVAGRIMTPTVTRGYAYVQLSKNDRKVKYTVHRLVAVTFLGPPPYGDAVVNHIDGIKANNAPRNLEWCSQKENNQHAHRLGLVRHAAPLFGERNGRAVLARRQVEIIRQLNGIVGHDLLAELLGVSRSLIQRIRQGKLWPEHVPPVHQKPGRKDELRVREMPRAAQKAEAE